MLYQPIISKQCGNITQQENFKLLKKTDNQARSEGKLLHRYLDFPWNDIKSFYQVVKVLNDKVEIAICKGVDKNFEIPYFGKGCLIDKKLAVEIVAQRDYYEKQLGKAVS